MSNHWDNVTEPRDTQDIHITRADHVFITDQLVNGVYLLFSYVEGPTENLCHTHCATGRGRYDENTWMIFLRCGKNKDTRQSLII